MEAWDVLILGGTLEGMRSAIAAHDAGANVAIVSSKGLGDSNISHLNSGIAASINEDTTQGHRDDTIRSGEWLCDQDIVSIRISSALNHISQLESWGLNFRRDTDGLPFTEHSFGHKSARITTAGDSTARQLQYTLEEQCIKRGISRRGDYFILSLVTKSNQINGVVALDMNQGKIIPIQCKTLIIADGGFESAWKMTGSAGRGMQLAMEQGIGLKNMEFQAWSPFYVSDDTTSLSLSIIGNGGNIVTSSGDRYDIDFSSTSNHVCINMLKTGNKFGINAKEINGDIGVWSFENKKHISGATEGGIITTNNKLIAEKIRKFVGIGYKNMTASGGRTSLSIPMVQDPNYERFDTIGLNYRMPQIVAAVCLAQLINYKKKINNRIKVASFFRKAIANCDWLIEQKIPDNCKHTHFTFSLRYFGYDKFNISWKQFYNKYKKIGGDGFYGAWICPHLEPALQNYFKKNKINNIRKGHLPIAENLQKEIMQFKTNYRNIKVAQKKARLLEKLVNEINNET